MAEETPQPNKTPMGDPLAGKSDAELDRFFLSGDLTAAETPEADPDAEAAAAKPVEQASSTGEIAAVPDTATPKKATKPVGQKKTAAERAEEIEREADAENVRLQAALERRRKTREAREEAEREEPGKRAEKVAEAAAAPGTKEAREAARKKFSAMPDAPKSKDYADLDDWATDLNIFIGEKIAEEKFGTLYDARTKADRADQERGAAWQRAATEGFERASKELDADPELVNHIDPRLEALAPIHMTPPEKITPAHYVKDRVMLKTHNPLNLLAWLSDNDSAELRRIARLPPDQVVAELAYKDAEFDRLTTEADPEPAAGARAHARISKAPAPSRTLGKKPAQGVDPLKQAIAENDFDTFNAIESGAAAGRG